MIKTNAFFSIWLIFRCNGTRNGCENWRVLRPAFKKDFDPTWPGPWFNACGRKGPRCLVREVFIIHVGGTRCVTSSTDNIMKIRARITLTVEFIRTCIFIFWFYVWIQWRVWSRLTFFFDFYWFSVQRNWRGLMGRRRYAMKRKEEWAVRLLQRNWRGKSGREAYLAKREKRNAAMMLQRIYRGRVAKRRGTWSLYDTCWWYSLCNF